MRVWNRDCPPLSRRATRPSATPPRTSGCRRGRTASSITRPASSRTPSGRLPPWRRICRRSRASIRKIWSCTRSCSSCSSKKRTARRSCGRWRPPRRSRSASASTTRSSPPCRRRTAKTPPPRSAPGSRRRGRFRPSHRRPRPCCDPRSRKNRRPRLKSPPARRPSPGWTRNGSWKRRSTTCGNLTV